MATLPDFKVTETTRQFVKSVAISPTQMKCSVVTQTDRFSLDWRQVLKLIFGNRLHIKAVTYTQNEPGKVTGKMFATVAPKDYKFEEAQ